MGALLESLAAGFSGDAAQRRLLDAAVRGGLPQPRSETWRYTALRALERRTFTPAPGRIADFDGALLDAIPAPRLVFVNGCFAAAHSDVNQLPAGVQFHAAAPFVAADSVAETADAVFFRLNAALATTGARLQVAADTVVSAPLHLVFISTATGQDNAWHLRHQLNIARGAQVHLLEYHLADGTQRHLNTAVTELDLAEYSHVLHARIQNGSDGETHFLRTQGTLHARAQYTRMDIESGSALARHELNVDLAGEGAALIANGVLPAAQRRHVETRVEVHHHAKNTRCDLLWRGIGAGRGRVVFHGGITIHPGADGTDARLSSKNLLLSDTAEIDTRPVLVIHADEVNAAHGATVGQLDADALFYLRTRGLSRSEAQQLLAAAFVREPLLPLAHSPLHALIERRLDHALAALA